MAMWDWINYNFTQGCPEPSPELLLGDPVITETLHNRNFDISPQVSILVFSYYMTEFNKG